MPSREGGKQPLRRLGAQHGDAMRSDSAGRAAASLSLGPPLRWSPASGRLHPQGDGSVRNGARARLESSVSSSGEASEEKVSGSHLASQNQQEHLQDPRVRAVGEGLVSVGSVESC